MKKTLLMALFVLPLGVWAQGQELRSNQEDFVDTPTAAELDGSEAPKGATSSGTSVSLLKYKAQPFTFIQVGETAYDLQTNSSVGTRIILHADGTVSTTWTTSADQNNDAFPSRGSGYNYFDGTNWSPVVSLRVETVRTGWPSIGTLANGSEYIMAHDAGNGGFALNKNGTKGSTTWSETYPLLDDNSVPSEERAPIWNRTASSGDYIFHLSNYTSSGNNAEVTRSGVLNPTMYSRSKDGGATWDIALSLLPGYDSTLYLNGGADAYAITARDSVVAIVMGNIADPVMVWKSVDSGTTFTQIPVDNFPYPGVSESQWPVGDTFNTTDGSMDIILDHDEKVHVVYGYTYSYRAVDPGSGDTGVFYSPGQARIMHWREGMSDPQAIAFAIDRDFSGVYEIESETLVSLTNGSLPNNPNTGAPYLTSARYGNNCLATFPSIGIADNGDLFVTYSLPQEYAISDFGANFRDVMVTYSEDNGDNWANAQNITQNDFEEHVFASVAERVDNNMHMVWQVDDIPGTNLQNNDANASNHLITENKIMYAAIPTSAIKNGELGQHTLSTEPVERKAEVFFVSQSYPNPNAGSADVTVFLLNGADVTVQITDMFGKIVNQANLGFINAGNHVLNLDVSELSSGMYFYTISTPEHSMTRKMQVH